MADEEVGYDVADARVVIDQQKVGGCGRLDGWVGGRGLGQGHPPIGPGHCETGMAASCPA